MEPNSSNPRQEFGPMVGAVIIVALFVIGGIYFFLVQEPRNEEPLFEEETELPANSADF